MLRILKYIENDASKFRKVRISWLYRFRKVVAYFLFKEMYGTDSIYRVYKDKLQNCSCNQFQ